MHTLLLVLPLLTLVAEAQTAPSRWDAVRMLPPQTEVRVAAGTAAPLSGTLDSVTETALVLNLPGRQQTFEKTQITSVAVKKNGHRARNALIGLGIGAGAGIGVGAATTVSPGGWGGLRGAAIGVVGCVGALIGTVIGVAWPTGGWHEIYSL